MWRAAIYPLKLWLGRRAAKPEQIPGGVEPIPFPLERRMAHLSMLSHKGGNGSDLAAAELKGMQTVILAQRATGWRGQAVRR